MDSAPEEGELTQQSALETPTNLNNTTQPVVISDANGTMESQPTAACEDYYIHI